MNQKPRFARCWLTAIVVLNLHMLLLAYPANLNRSVSLRNLPTLIPPMTASSAQADSPRTVVIALLANNQLAAIDTKTGNIVAQKKLGPFPDAAERNDGQYIAMSAAGDHVYVLLGGQGMEMSRLAVLDWPTLTVVTPNLLPKRLSSIGAWRLARAPGASISSAMCRIRER